MGMGMGMGHVLQLINNESNEPKHSDVDPHPNEQKKCLAIYLSTEQLANY